MSMALKRGVSRSAKTETEPASCWQTPQYLVERVRSVLGTIELDPCPTEANPVGASRIYTPADDGILQPWNAATIYVNPPYGRTIKHWVEKCLWASQQHSKVILLCPARTDSKWFQSAWAGATDALFIAGRIQFENGAKKDNAPFPCVLFGFRVSLEKLSDLGTRAVAA